MVAALNRQPKLIEIEPQVKTEQVEKKKPKVKKKKPGLTLEQKIKRDINNCEPSHYISAEDASCIPKPKEKPAVAPVRASGGLNTYEYGQCTWGVKNWKPSVPNDWGHAKYWGYRAEADGWTVSSRPIVGAVAWSARGYYGHVALVLSVNGDTVTIREQNYDWNGSVRTNTVPVSTYTYIY